MDYGNMHLKLYKIVFFFSTSLVLLSFLFLNLGKWMDCTQKPKKADMVICLGGGTTERVKTSVMLLKHGYVNKKHFLLIGESWYNQPYLKKHYHELNVTIDETPKNTAEEIAAIKKFMLKHGYSSALIVTDPPHSARVALLLSLIDPQDSTLHFRIIGSHVAWWDPKHYYRNTRALKAVWHESLGILYSIWQYGIVKPFKDYL